MKTRIRTHKQRRLAQSSNFSPAFVTPEYPVHQSKPTETTAAKSARKDLPTTISRARHYGHHIDKYASNASTAIAHSNCVVQPRLEIGSEGNHCSNPTTAPLSTEKSAAGMLHRVPHIAQTTWQTKRVAQPQRNPATPTPIGRNAQFRGRPIQRQPADGAATSHVPPQPRLTQLPPYMVPVSEYSQRNGLNEASDFNALFSAVCGSAGEGTYQSGATRNPDNWADNTEWNCETLSNLLIGLIVYHRDHLHNPNITGRSTTENTGSRRVSREGRYPQTRDFVNGNVMTIRRDGSQTAYNRTSFETHTWVSYDRTAYDPLMGVSGEDVESIWEPGRIDSNGRITIDNIEYRYEVGNAPPVGAPIRSGTLQEIQEEQETQKPSKKGFRKILRTLSKTVINRHRKHK